MVVGVEVATLMATMTLMMSATPFSIKFLHSSSLGTINKFQLYINYSSICFRHNLMNTNVCLNEIHVQTYTPSYLNVHIYIRRYAIVHTLIYRKRYYNRPQKQQQQKHKHQCCHAAA